MTEQHNTVNKQKHKCAAWIFPILPILLCLVLAVILYYPVFLKGYWAVNRSDALHIHLPSNNIIASLFRQGQLPLWNPGVNLGQPIIDGFSLIFHPALVLYLFFIPWLANSIEILLGLVLAFLGIWYFLRQQGFEAFPASAGMLAYVLAGPVFFLHSYHLDFMAIVLLPWALLIFHQHDRTKYFRWLWGAAILCVLAVQSIELDTLIYFYLALLIDRLASIPKDKNERKIYTLKWGGIFILSCLTGLLSYLPLYEWLFYSSRLTKSYAGVLNPDWLNMVTAMFTNQWLTSWPYNNYYFYFGPALIWLVLAGLVRFNRAVYAFRYFLFSLVIPVSYIAIRSLQSFLPGWLGSLDIWRSMFVFCFGLAMVVAIGVRSILNRERYQRWLALLCGLFTAALAIWAIYSSMYACSKYIILFLAAMGMLIVIFSTSRKTIVLRFLGIYIALAVTLITSALFFVTDERFCLVATNSSLIRKLSFYNALGKDSYGKEGHWRVSVFGPTDNTTALVGLKTLPNYTCIYNQEMEKALVADDLIKPQSRHPYWMRLDNPDAYVLSFYGVRFLVALDNILAPENMPGWVKRTDLAWHLYAVWENKKYIGRAYLVKTSGERYSGNVEFLEDTPVSVTLRAKAEEGEWLVLADLNYPGWQARVDGKLVPTEAYHGCLRLVELSKGTHIVQWKYNGIIQWLGIIFSLIALFFLLAFLVTLTFLKEIKEKISLLSKIKMQYPKWLVRILPVFWCIFLVIIVYHSVFFLGYWAVNQSDALYIHIPGSRTIVETFLKGQLPIWNPKFNLGQPVIDGFAQIFHIGQFFYFFLNPWLAHTIVVLFGLLLSFLGTWYFLRQQGFKIFPAAIGTLVYVLCGPVFFLHSYQLGFMAILLLPWMLWIFHQYDRTKQSRMLWLAAILCVIAVQSIEFDTLFYLYLGFIIDRLLCFPVSKRKIYASTWMAIFIFSGLSGLLTYLPLQEWVAYSSRLSKSYLGALTPDSFNMLSAMLTNQWLTVWSYDSFYFYFGPALIWLVLAGLVRFNRTVYAFRYFLFSLVIPVSYITIRSLQFFLPGWLGSLDIWRSMFVFCFGLAMIAAIGVENILEGKPLQRRLACWVGLLIVALTCWVIYFGALPNIKYKVFLITAAGVLIILFSLTSKFYSFRFLGVSIVIMCSSLIPAMAHIRFNNPCTRKIVPLATILKSPQHAKMDYNSILGHLIYYNSNTLMNNVRFYSALSKTIDGGDGHWRVSVLGTDNLTALAGLKTIPNYTCVYNKDMEDSLYSDGLIVRNNKLPYWMQLDNPDASALSFYGVRFLVVLTPRLIEKDYIVGWTKRPDLSWSSDYAVWENKKYIGRAYLVKTSGERYSGNVEFLEDTPVSVTLRAKAEEGEWLVLADLNYPGWQAWVDGKLVPTEAYHGCLRSVELSKGTHVVQWKYNGIIQWLGIILSLIALFFLMIFLVILSFLKRKTDNYKQVI